MGIPRHRPDAEVAVEDALPAERELRTALAIEGAALLQRAVALGEPALQVEERRQIRTSRLLFALDEEPQPDGQLAEHGAMRFHRLDPQQQMSLVVVDATRVQRPVAQAGVVRRCLPELERDSGLDVVVLDGHEGALWVPGLADDEGRSAVRTQLARVGEAGGAQPIAAPAGRLVGRLARDRAELAQLGHEPRLLRRDETVQLVRHAHGRSMAAALSA